MKILVLTTFYPEEHRNDLIKDTAVVQYFAQEWNKAGHEIVILHLYAHNFKNIFHYNYNKYGCFQECHMDGNIKVYLMENQFFIRNAKKYLKIQQKNITRKINKLLVNELKNFTPDVLIVHFPSHFYGIVNNLNLKCNKIATLHTTDIKAARKSNKMRKYINNTYNKIFSRSYSIQKEMKKVGFDTNNIAFSGIDKSRIVTKDFIEKNKWKSKKIKILYAGSFLKRKNVDKIILALSKDNIKFDYEFYIVGDGKNRKKYEKLVNDKNLNDKIIFVGKISRDDVFNYMKKADLFITISENETLGLTYLEAMASGCIAIGSTNEGIDGIIKNENNGFLIQAGDIEALNKLLIKISKMSREDKMRIINESINSVKEFTSEKVAKNYIDAITDRGM